MDDQEVDETILQTSVHIHIYLSTNICIIYAIPQHTLPGDLEDKCSDICHYPQIFVHR